jgi:heavy metal translocating P-type ATPase
MAKGRFYVDTIAALAILVSWIEHEFLAGALVVLMQSGGQALEDFGLRRANRSLDNLLKRAPSIAHRREGAGYVDVPCSELQSGDVVCVRPGDIIPADGVVVEGTGSVDESALTGEPVPLAKSTGDPVYSGTINLTGSLWVRATATAAESKYEHIVRMVQEAGGEKAPINRLANRYAPAFTVFTLALAGGVFLITHSSARALSVLVVATPCPLIIATPLAVLSAINRAAALNIIVKSGAAVERAGEVAALVFDKTGTLTSGSPSLIDIYLFDAEADVAGGRDEILRQAASVEMLCSHTLARSVVTLARERGLTLAAAHNLKEAPGTGVSGDVDGRRVVIGSEGFLRSEGIQVTSGQREARAAIAVGGRTVALVAIGGAVSAMLVFEDRLRQEAPDLIQRLERMGIHRIVMLTGDAADTAESVAKSLGIPEYQARLQPADKLAAIQKIAAEAPVMMVGDGINDAPALAVAHVGVAMGSFGAGVATDAADVVITVDNVERVADVIEIGRNMVGVARQGILFGLGASILLMLAAAGGGIPPATGALLQELIDLAAILNALRGARSP